MTSLVACLGEGKGSVPYIKKLIESEPWDAIFIVTEESGLAFAASKPVRFVVVKEDQFLVDMVKSVHQQLDGKIPDLEVAVNFVSGSGKMHMAIFSALLKCGLGIRLVALTPDGMKEI